MVFKRGCLEIVGVRERVLENKLDREGFERSTGGFKTRASKAWAPVAQAPPSTGPVKMSEDEHDMVAALGEDAKPSLIQLIGPADSPNNGDALWSAERRRCRPVVSLATLLCGASWPHRAFGVTKDVRVALRRKLLQNIMPTLDQYVKDMRAISLEGSSD